MEVPYRNKKTGAVSPGLRCMKPHMKNHPWCRQAKSAEGPSITGSKFQREGSNYDAWAISEIGKFEGNVAHSMNSGVWISGCTKNVAVFEGTVIHHTTSGFQWLKNEGSDQGADQHVGKGGMNCDSLALDDHWDRDQDVDMAGHEARLVVLKNSVIADNLYNGRWDGNHNFGFEWIDPLIVGFSNNPGPLRIFNCEGGYERQRMGPQFFVSEKDVNHRLGLLTAWTTKVRGAVCAGFPFDFDAKEQNACFGSSARLHEKSFSRSNNPVGQRMDISNAMGLWSSVIPSNPTSQISDFFTADNSNAIWMNAEMTLGSMNGYSWYTMHQGFALRNSAIEDVDGSLTGLGPHSWIYGDTRKYQHRRDTRKIKGLTNAPTSYVKEQKGTECMPGTVINTKEECSKALGELGLDTTFGWSGSHSGVPSGCSYRKGSPHFNTNAAGKGRDDLAPICKNKGYEFMGCFKDEGNRAMPINAGNVGKDVSKCAELCKAKSMPFMGLQHDDCFCSSTEAEYSKYGKVQDKDCSVQGNGGTAGGNWRNSVYKVESQHCSKLAGCEVSECCNSNNDSK